MTIVLKKRREKRETFVSVLLCSSLGYCVPLFSWISYPPIYLIHSSIDWILLNNQFLQLLYLFSLLWNILKISYCNLLLYCSGIYAFSCYNIYKFPCEWSSVKREIIITIFFLLNPVPSDFCNYHSIQLKVICLW